MNIKIANIIVTKFLSVHLFFFDKIIIQPKINLKDSSHNLDINFKTEITTYNFSLWNWPRFYGDIVTWIKNISRIIKHLKDCLEERD